MRTFVIAANWKMYKTPHEAKRFVMEFLPLITRSLHRRIMIFPTALCLPTMLEVTKDHNLDIGAQNCHFQAEGAFTGENSPKTIADLGARAVLVGHSERRALFGETDSYLAQKVKAVQDFGMSPMLCVGESLAERDAGQTEAVIEKQLREGLSKADLQGRLIIAYEPVWAIGTGKVATPDQAEKAHKYLRSVLHELAGENVATQTSILYGGSVKPNNAAEIGSQLNIDGFLVGGASLEPKDFATIVNVSIK